MKLLRFFIISMAIVPGLAAVARAQARLTLPYSWEPQQRGQRPVAVPSGKVAYVETPTIFVAHNGPRQMTLRTKTTLSIDDTLRLRADAKPIVASFDAAARTMNVQVINVQFESDKETVSVGGTVRPQMWIATFARGADGRWVRQKSPRRSIQLDVRP